jgi:hypothetical protein
VVRLNKIAGALRTSKTETLHRAAFIPVQKPAKPESTVDPKGPEAPASGATP